jgi:hypothetical protein
MIFAITVPTKHRIILGKNVCRIAMAMSMSMSIGASLMNKQNSSNFSGIGAKQQANGCFAPEGFLLFPAK